MFKLHLRHITSCHKKCFDVTVDVAPIVPSDGCSLQSQEFGSACVIMSDNSLLSTLLYLFFLCDAPVNFWLNQLITNFKYPTLHSRTKPSRSRVVCTTKV